MNKSNQVKDSFAIGLLSYPLDHALILRKKQVIKRELMLKEQLIPIKIALLGGSTTAEIRDILELFLLNIGIRPDFYESGFNRYYEEAVFDNAALTAFQPDIIYLHNTHKDITSFPEFTDSLIAIEQLQEAEQNRYTQIWNSLNKYQCSIIQNNFDYPQYRVLGNLDSVDPHGTIHYINVLNGFFVKEAQKRNNLYIHDINYLSSSLGLSHWFDKELWHLARYAVSYKAIPHLAQSLAALIGSLLGFSKKCLVLDLDNTCWGGEIADHGIEGIIIGRDSPYGEAYSDFQSYAKRLKDRGIALAVCSKNNIAQAKAGFDHPNTILKESDFVAFEANWEPKYKSLVNIAKQLNLNLDSIIFIDDNPAERQLINGALPEVKVPDVTEDVNLLIEYLDKNYYFEPNIITEEDSYRTQFYKRKAKLTTAIEPSLDYDGYLKTLNMNAEIKPFSLLYLPRIHQLLNKTHQFNLTNISYSFAEIKALSNNDNYLNLYGRLTDSYGEHGLISVIISRINNTECNIESWVMSCRVFNRTMEHAMLDILVEHCRSSAIKTITAEYCPSTKNSFVSQLYKDLGFTQVEVKSSQNKWSINIDQYKLNNRHIKVNQ